MDRKGSDSFRNKQRKSIFATEKKERTIRKEMKNLIIFDLDGTLLNTIDDLGCAVNHALALRDLPQHGMEEYRTMVGNGVRKLIERALPQDAQDLVEDCLKDFLAYYTENIDVHTRPYPGMDTLIGKLDGEGCLLAVASNKFQEGTAKLVERFFPGIDFVAVFGNRPGYPLKPDPELIREIEDLAGRRCGEALNTIMVGDSDTDMKTAANAGIASVAVCWGFRSRAELEQAGAVRFAGTAEELYSKIQEVKA